MRSTTSRRTFLEQAVAVATLTSLTSSAFAEADGLSIPRTITCEGTYPQHLQGICTNNKDRIFWSFTTTLVITDFNGKVLRTATVALHHGAPCFVGGRIYVAVNLAKFDDAASLGFKQNFLYEYDKDMKFVRTIRLESGYTEKGIQTLAFNDGHWWFGCYGHPPVLLKVDPSFQRIEKFEFSCALGIVPVAEKRFLVAQGNPACADQGGCDGRLVSAVADVSKGLVYTP